MKKLIILLLALMLIGCSNTKSAEELTAEVETLNTEVGKLKSEKEALMEQVKTISADKMIFDTENTELKAKLEELQESNAALKVEQEALQKKLDAVAENQYEAQFNFDVRIMQTFNGQMKYVFEKAAIPHAQYYLVIGENPSDEIKSNESDILTFGDDTYEVTSLVVEGTIYNFKWSNIEWHADSSDFTITDTIKAVDEITNQRVNIHTMLPEGLPGQILTWENKAGKQYQVLLSYDGYGFEGFIILSQ